MDYRKKIKTRICVAAVYIVIGIALLVLGIFIKTANNETIIPFGVAFSIMGILRIIQYSKIMRSESDIKKQKIKETDERNVMIWTKAKCMAFDIYALLGAAAIIIMYILNMTFIAQIIAYNMCTLLLAYLICSFILNKIN